MPDRRVRVRASSVAFGTVLALLAGCGGDEVPEDQDAATLPPPVAEIAPTGCPGINIPNQLAEITEFVPGSSRRPEYMAWRATIVDYAGGCTYDGETVTVDLDTQFLVELGDAFEDEEVTFDYFVAVLRPDGSGMAKQVFTFSVEVPEEIGSQMAADPTEHVIPLQVQAEGPAYELWVGFQATQDQLDFNRR